VRRADNIDDIQFTRQLICTKAKRINTNLENETMSNQNNYLFGYGSLIEDESRERTTPTARYAWPVEVKGIKRGWWARGAASGMTTTYLGALKEEGALCNGIIYPVTEEELKATDARETAGYERCEIKPKDITMLDGRREPPGGYERCEIKPKDITMLDGRREPPGGKYWAYISKLDSALKNNLASPQFPIVQSYVDICINGCLEIEGKYPTAQFFTARFIETTHEWNKYWVNDRIYPRRPFIYRPTASQIDMALSQSKHTAHFFYEAELEPATWEDRKPVRPIDPKDQEVLLELLQPGAWERGG
jgi:hypothetical protein